LPLMVRITVFLQKNRRKDTTFSEIARIQS